MCKFVNNGEHNHIDKCMKKLIIYLKETGLPIHACCCGHFRYEMSIVVSGVYKGKGVYYDLLSGKEIPRKRRFYKRDKKGYYYIPEVIKKQL